MPRPNNFKDDKADDENDFHDSSEEEEDEDQDRYEEDDFIVDDGDDEEDGGGHDSPLTSGRALDAEDDDDTRHLKSKKKKKKRRHHEDPDLAEEDLELLKDSGVRVDRKKRLKRLRKGASDEEVEDDLAAEIRNLNRDDDDEEPIDEGRRRIDDSVDDDDDMDDFIDDGGRSRRRRAAERDGLVSSEAVRTARSIFGDVEEITQLKDTSRSMTRDRLGDGIDEDEDDDYHDPDKLDEPQGRRRFRDRDGYLSDAGDDEQPSDVRPRQAESREIAEGLAASDNKEKAKRIVDEDVPERLQYHFGTGYVTPSEAEIRDEANWIFRKGFLDNPQFSSDPRYQSDDLVQKISVFLSYVHIDKLDIPFIAMYRRDYLSPLLIHNVGEGRRTFYVKDREPEPMQFPRGFNSIAYDGYNSGLTYEDLRGVQRGYDDGFGDWSILWYILDQDKKYYDMIRRRNALLRAIDESTERGIPAVVLDDVRTMAHACDEEREIKDGERHLRLAVELADALNKEGIADDFDDEIDRRSRRPSRRRNRYGDFCKRGYRSLTKEFGITARQFGENLKGVSDYGAGGQAHVPMESDNTPLDAARLLAIRTGEITGDLSNVDDKHATRILNAARYVLTTEIAGDTAVLQATRRILCRPGTVTISTTPTTQGMAQVDDTHPLRRVTSLSEKKIETFRNTADYALIRRAEELGFATMKIQFREEQTEVFHKHLVTSVLTQNSTSAANQQWNDQRLKIVEDVQSILIGIMMDEVKADLEEMTSSVLRQKLCDAASRRFLLGPARLSADDDGCPRVLAFLVTSEDDEEADPLLQVKDVESAKERNEGSVHRVAPERITVVDLDENGEYANGYELFASWLRRPMRKVKLESAHSDLPIHVKEQLKTYILNSRAQLIVIGIGSGQRAPLRLQSDLVDVIKEIVRHKSEDGHYGPQPALLSTGDVYAIRNPDAEPATIHSLLSSRIILCDDFPCQIYANTEWASVGLTVDAMTLLEKRAIALARLAQEPLWVYCAIGQEHGAASRFQIHPYHFYAKSGDRETALVRALIRAVCTTGVDINRMLRLPHTQVMLPYVGGLGKHKGNALLKQLSDLIVSEDDRGLDHRKSLWSHHFLGRVVFLSVAAYLRVRNPDLHNGGNTKRVREMRRKWLSRSRSRRRDDEDGRDVYNPLDDTRVHPEYYAVAIKIADESLRDERGRLRIDVPDNEKDLSHRIASAVIDNPEGLKRLDLEEYAKHLESSGRGSLYETVQTIANEFDKPFKDWRCPLVSPDEKAIFYIVTGSDPILLRHGSKVTATSCQIRTRNDRGAISVVGISCLLPNNVRGFIPFKQFSDKGPMEISDVRTLVPDGSSLACRVTGFNFGQFEAVLSSQVSVIRDPTLIPLYVPIIDTTDVAFRPYPKNAGENDQMHDDPALQKEKIREKFRKSNFSKLNATVPHHLFKNLSGEQAIDVLKNSLPGDILIRPSPYRPDEIIFSCKFASLSENYHIQSILHINCKVVEGRGVRDSNPVAFRYKINGKIFEQIDQALEEYVRPIISNLSEAIDHRKFREGTNADLKRLMEKERQLNATSIPYCFGISEKHAASLVLVFIPGSKTVVFEDIIVVPNGYRYRQTLHKSMEKLITWFKLNYRENVAVAPYTTANPLDGQGGSSGFRARSPFSTAASPYHAAASPYHAPAGLSPAPPVVPVTAHRDIAVPAKDMAPPSAPRIDSANGANLRGDMRIGGNRRIDPYPSNPGRGNNAMDWSGATRQVDEPPPVFGSNGGRTRDIASNGGGIGRNYVADRRGGPGPGPGPRRTDYRGDANGDNDKMPSWRGQAPVPAWVKQQGASKAP